MRTVYKIVISKQTHKLLQRNLKKKKLTARWSFLPFLETFLMALKPTMHCEELE